MFKAASDISKCLKRGSIREFAGALESRGP